MEDGVVFRHSETDFLLTAARHTLGWFADLAHRMRVTIEDVSDDLGILAVTDRVWASDSNDPVERQDIQRWTQLLLYADGRNLPWRSDPLVQLVGTRARFMELAARAMRPSDDVFADAAFMTGIFSLVHVVVDMPPVEILELLQLSGEIRAAIVDGQGPLGMLLRISQAAERGDAPEVDLSIGAFGRSFRDGEPQRLMQGFLDRKR